MTQQAFPVNFPATGQDKNAFNSGDCVKFVLDDAVGAFLKVSGRATLIDSHAGAGAYPVKIRGPVARGDSYYADMKRAVAKIPFTVGGRPVEFLGVGPMLLHRHLSLDYVGFEANAEACERINSTFTVLGGKRRAANGDGWTGAEQTIRSASASHPLVVFLDPFTYSSNRSELQAVLSALGARKSAHGLLGMFIPGTHTRGGWLDWRGVEDFAGKWAAALSWPCVTFSLRERLSSGALATHNGRVQHFSLLVSSSMADPIREAKNAWAHRRADKSFARWTKLT